MAQSHGITLRFQGNGTWSPVEHPGSANLSRLMRSERSHRKIEQGDGDAQPMMANSEALVGSATVTK